MGGREEDSREAPETPLDPPLESLIIPPHYVASARSAVFAYVQQKGRKA